MNADTRLSLRDCDSAASKARPGAAANSFYGRSALRSSRALTLVELMVVIVILGVLATTVTVSVRDYLVTGKQNAARQELAQIKAALDLYFLENDRYPSSAEGLALLRQANEKHPDGLLQGGDLNDPWNHPYEYVCPGLHGSFDLICFGADGVEGGRGANADIVSWSKP